MWMNDRLGWCVDQWFTVLIYDFLILPIIRVFGSDLINLDWSSFVEWVLRMKWYFLTTKTFFVITQKRIPFTQFRFLLCFPNNKFTLFYATSNKTQRF